MEHSFVTPMLNTPLSNQFRSGDPLANNDRKPSITTRDLTIRQNFAANAETIELALKPMHGTIEPCPIKNSLSVRYGVTNRVSQGLTHVLFAA